ncbi:MAG: 6-bladed beta-propeller, partial [Nitrospirota bacterium]
GHIFVVDGLYDTVQIFNRQGELLMNFGETGGTEGDFYLPAGIAIDNRNRIYVADTYNQRVAVFQFMGEPLLPPPAPLPEPDAAGKLQENKAVGY